MQYHPRIEEILGKKSGFKKKTPKMKHNCKCRHRNFKILGEKATVSSEITQRHGCWYKKRKNMAKIIVICGKICRGKTYYVN